MPWRLLLPVLLFVSSAAQASGPRYVTGWPAFYSNGGGIVPWNTSAPLYFTDPGNLSAYVNHQAADALVNAAATVWNVPVANLTLAQGGALAEHVNGSNVYLSSSGMVYPADVASSNSQNIPIAVIYDSDGSVTDTLLGGGASDPAECRQNAVTESVDGFSLSGYITHAVLIVNGRCTGPAAAQQTQLQYQLMRAFGRILGLAWSQTNDNVFTGTPAANYDQAMNWPILHPIDILCGFYTYQCLPMPFQLRPDDIASLVTVYPITSDMLQSSTPPASGKVASLAQANTASGLIQFPTGEGMAGVNVVVQRIDHDSSLVQDYQTASAVTGMQFRRVQTTPVAAPPGTLYAGEGSYDPNQQGYYYIAYIPLVTPGWVDSQVLTSQPINPLYSGSYAVGPYGSGSVEPSGSPMTRTAFGVYAGSPYGITSTIADAASTCGSGTDGTATQPVPPASTGWGNGLLCGYGHDSWTNLDVRAGRTLTLEVTALDEQGYATTAKLRPVMGAWASTDSTSSLPTLGAITGAFNALALGMTSLNFPTGSATGVQMVIADERGDGRPDYAYQSRVLYADSIFPSTVPAAGASAAITGIGFRPGNVVKINGVAANVTSWTSNTINLTVPTMSVAHATNLNAVDVVVSDISTGGSSTMSGALTYDTTTPLPKEMKLLSVQVGSSPAGSPTSVPFSVQVLAGDGITPVAGESVVFSGSVGGAPGSVQFAVCGAATCTVTTDASGVASTGVTPASVGTVNVSAVDNTLSQTATFTSSARAGAMQLLSAPTGSVYVGDSASTPFTVKIFGSDGTTPAPGQEVTFSTTSGSVTFDTCVATPCAVLTDSQGVASTGVTPRSAGATSIRAGVGTLSQAATFTAVGNTPMLNVLSEPSGSYPVQTRAPANFTVALTQANGVTPMPSQQVTFSATPISSDAVPGGITFGACSGPSCTLTTDYQGQASVYVSLVSIGTYRVQAAFQNIVQTTTITVANPTVQLRVISAPTGNQALGQFLPTPFTVQLVYGDNDTPISGAGINMGGASGAVALQNCGISSCVVWTDSNGYSTIHVEPLTLGTITLFAVINSLQTTISFNSVDTIDTMQLVSSPSGTVYANQAAATPFSVRIIGAGQTSGTSGKSVVLSVTGGSATFPACGAATCTVLTDANGIASSVVTPLAAGIVSLLAADGVVTQSASFAVSPQPDILRLVSAPSGSVTVGQVAPTPFAVRALLPDGVTPAAGRSVTVSVSSGSANIIPCGSPGCVLQADSNGNVSTTVQPLAPGPIAVVAIDGSVSQTATFNALAGAETLRLVRAPSGSVNVGSVSAVPFAVQVLAYDGVTPVAGRSVTFNATSGSVALGGCTSLPCVLASDTNGNVSTTVQPLAPGPVSLIAADGSATQSATFNALSTADIFRTLSSPSGSVNVGSAAAIPFVLQVLAADGVTPVAGRTLTLTVTSGSVALSGCSSTPCLLTTGASGLVSSTLTPTAAGNITVQAADGTLVQSATVQGVGNTDALTAASPQLYIAENATILWPLAAIASVNGSAGSGLAILWTGSPALNPSGAQSYTGPSGITTVPATAGPLAAGASASAGACIAAQPAVCATFQATGSSATTWQVQTISGATQSATGGAALGSVVAEIVDAAGHAIAGAPVTVAQTVTERNVPCPTRGRCPAAPVLTSGTVQAVTDSSGQVTIVPLTFDGLATVTNIAVSAGTAGFATVTLTRTP